MFETKERNLLRHLSKAIQYAEETGRKELARELLVQLHALAKRIAEDRPC